MAQKQIAMEKLKEIILLKEEQVSIREISRRVGISRNSVRKYLERLEGSGAGNSGSFAEAAYGQAALRREDQKQQLLAEHFEYVRTELQKTGVTRMLLWEEYISQHPEGYSYSQYCYHLNHYLKNSDRVMHLEYKAGDLMMIDFAGQKLHYVDTQTGEQISCEVFVAILPFSGLIFCCAVHSQQSEDFLSCINAMLRYYAGVPTTILCDNLKTAVVRHDRYEPVFTDLCYQLGEHYQCTFSATRPYTPRDKGMVEGAVKITYTQVHAPLRNRVFTSIQALNHAIGQQVEQLNNKPYKGTPFSRRYYFEQQEQLAMKPLPSQPFMRKKTVTLTVQRNYHVQLSETSQYFSVPDQYVGKKVKVLYDRSTVEVYYDHQRFALHTLGSLHNKVYHTIAEHMPSNHQYSRKVSGWTKEDLLDQAALLGPSVHQAAELILSANFFVEQNYKACHGLLMLAKKYSKQRLQQACDRALTGSRVNYTMIKNILLRGLDQVPVQKDLFVTPDHANIRGPHHYQ